MTPRPLSPGCPPRAAAAATLGMAHTSASSQDQYHAVTWDPAAPLRVADFRDRAASPAGDAATDTDDMVMWNVLMSTNRTASRRRRPLSADTHRSRPKPRPPRPPRPRTPSPVHSPEPDYNPYDAALTARAASVSYWSERTPSPKTDDDGCVLRTCTHTLSSLSCLVSTSSAG